MSLNKRTYTEGSNTIITAICTITKEPYTVLVSTRAFKLYITGKYLIQNLFPDHPMEQREFMISGTTPAEWNDMFSKSED